MTEVTQTDRDAALRLAVRVTGGLHPRDIQEVLEGRHDKNAIVTAFARHRLEERTKIVAWLRGMGLRNINYIADQIEAGEHLQEQSK